MGLFDKMKKNKEVLSVDRRNRNNEFIKKMGIACYENLPLTEASSTVKIKDIDVISRRAIACLLSTQVACDILNKVDYEESKNMFYDLVKKFDVENDLLEVERKLFDNNYTEQDALNVSWTYECYWSLVWALGLISNDDIKIPSNLCDCNKAIMLVSTCKDLNDFKSKIKIRNVEEILDMLDLYYRYHWACVEKRINPETNIGPLNSEVVWERRKGLEWLISDEKDWDNISLDT